MTETKRSRSAEVAAARAVKARGAIIARNWHAVARSLTSDELRNVWPKAWFATERWPGAIPRPPDDMLRTRADVPGSEPPDMPLDRLADVLRRIGLDEKTVTRLCTVPKCRSFGVPPRTIREGAHRYV